MLHEIVLKNLQQEGLLVDQRQVHLVLAYSGGMDSTVLLHVLSTLQKNYNLKITAAYFDHGWREQPAEELPLIHTHCKMMNIPLVMAPASRQIPHTETAAREARYYTLTHLTQDIKAQALITAHQADDQIETMLFRIFRGTGIDGLIGIQRKQVLHPDIAAPVSILRPMLDIKRADVKAYAKANGLEYFNDPSNSSRRHQRNIIRNEVVPFIEERFPQVKNTLYRLSHVTDGDLTILNDKIDEIWARIYRKETLDSALLNQLGRPYQRRVVKRFLLHHHLEFDFHHIEDIIDFVEGENRKNLSSALMSLNDKKFLSIYKGRISVVQKTQKATLESLNQIEALALSIPGRVSSDTLGVTVEVIELSEKEKATPELFNTQASSEIYVDLSHYQAEGTALQLRTRKPGDRIHPFGMASSMRLKNYFINRGVPRFERDRTPLLTDGKNILWVAGVGISESLRVENYPTHRLKIVKHDPEKTVTEDELALAPTESLK